MSKETLTLEELKELGATPIQKDVKSEYFKTATLEELKELGATPIVPKKVEPIVEKVVERTIEKIVVDDEKIDDLTKKVDNVMMGSKEEMSLFKRLLSEISKEIQKLKKDRLDMTAGVSPLVTQNNGTIMSSFTSVINFIGATVQARRDGGVDVTITGGGGGTGDVVGPASAVDGNFALFDTATGKLIKDGGASLAAFALSLAGLYTSKQDVLVSGTDIKTINGSPVLGSGDMVIPIGVNEDSFGIVVDGGGSAITTGSKGTKYIPWDCTITGWDIRSDISGDCVFNVKRSGVSIAGSEKPTLASASSNSDMALSTWTTSLSAGDVIEFVVDSAATLTRATVTILVNKV